MRIFSFLLRLIFRQKKSYSTEFSRVLGATFSLPLKKNENINFLNIIFTISCPSGFYDEAKKKSAGQKKKLFFR